MMVVLGQKCLYSGKLTPLGQSGCILANGCIWEIVVVFGQSGSVWAKLVVFGQTGCIVSICI